LFYEVDLVVFAVLNPLFLELVGEVDEVLHGIVRRNVVFLEVLHQHQDKEVQHDEDDEDDENHEENYIVG